MSYEIAINGGGIGGLFCALSLARLGHHLTVLEKHTDPHPSGAGIVLAQNAMVNFEELDLAEEVRRAGMSLTEMSIRTKSGAFLSKASTTTSLRGRPLSSVALHRSELSELLFSRCSKEPNIELRLGEEVLDAQAVDGRVKIRSLRGTESFDVLVGADGANSRVREILHGREPLRFSGYRCFRGVAAGDFGLGSSARESWGRGTRLGLVPISDRQTYWFAVENSAPGEAIPQGERKAYVLDRFGDYASPAGDVLAITPSDAILQHDLCDRLPLERWGQGPMTLLGDAAHPMTPNMGQGAGQAIEDGAFLAREFRVAAPGLEPALILRAYEHARIARANRFVVQSAQLGRLAQWENPVLCWLRNALVLLTPDRVTQRSLQRLLESGVPAAPPLLSSPSQNA